VDSDGAPALFKNLGNMKFKNVTSAALKRAKKGVAAAFVDVEQ
jgi:hypothetical protein